MSEMGRPELDVLRSDKDWEMLYQFMRWQATLEECASFFDCSEDTLNRRIKDKHNTTYAGLFKVKSFKGKLSLRRKQYETAMAGNTALLIFLGKNYLNQSDKVEHSGNETKPFTLNYVPKSKREAS